MNALNSVKECEREQDRVQSYPIELTMAAGACWRPLLAVDGRRQLAQKWGPRPTQGQGEDTPLATMSWREASW